MTTWPQPTTNGKPNLRNSSFSDSARGPAFRTCGFTHGHVHAANSAGLFAFPESRFNLVRPGGSLYGFRRDVLPASLDHPNLRPVMSLHSRIELLKQVKKGDKLGYGGTFETKRDSVIATIPIGYDDGYRRAFSNKSRVIVRESIRADRRPSVDGSDDH
jgi:alanine racemase